ncbi:MAG: hypothetical protein E7614_02105 [Ruminococcaceae bacterium]|nr:hypothetical protein [Oscillospiraceae bacterium]
MDYLNTKKNDSKNKKNQNSDELGKIYGITRTGKYYFPGKISSGCFDGNGLVFDREQNRKEDPEELYENSLEREYDPNGMYTGRPEIDGEVPVQDADDL